MIRSRSFTTFLVVIATAAQLPHAFEFIYEISLFKDIEWFRFSHSFLFAIALELAILFFTLRGKTNKAYFFATISCIMDIIVYLRVVETNIDYVSMIIVSIMLPVAIAMYSDEIKEDLVSSASGSPEEEIDDNEEEDIEPQPKEPQLDPLNNLFDSFDNLAKPEEPVTIRFNPSEIPKESVETVLSKEQTSLPKVDDPRKYKRFTDTLQ